MELITPFQYRLEARLSNALTLLSGINWCIPHHVKNCDYDLIKRKLDVTINDSLDGEVSRFFQSFYRDNTPSQFILLTVDNTGAERSRRHFENCVVLKHRVKTTEPAGALLVHRLIMRYEDLLVS